MPSAPLTSSSQSPKKGKAHAYNNKLTAIQEDKENQTSQQQNPIDGCSEDEHNFDSCTPERKIPHTPAVRIPFEDLIANTEDAFNCAPPLATPRDHVLWDPHSSDLSGAAAGTQRSRKRAHSSSPASSQHVSAQNDALNLDTLNKSLRTPNNDPTQDLWNRYTVANAPKNNQDGQATANYGHLIPSSPQTPSTTSKDGSLRRTHSCGVEWPTSKAKRRRIESNINHGRTKQLFAASRQDILRRDLSNNTRVGLLLEKIQESLTKKPVPTEESPSSSSPLPDLARRSQALVSPTRPQSQGWASRGGQNVADHVFAQASSPKSQGNAQKDKSFSSEFEDDGIDLEAFENLEHALEHEAEMETYNARNERRTGPSNAAEQMHEAGATSKELADETNMNEAPEEFDDEFYDDDEDIMDEMIGLAAQYDSQSKSPTEKQTNKVHFTAVQPKRLETLDEFDDAFDDDDDDLWNVIANATSLTGGGSKPAGSSIVDNRAIKRYLVIDVFESMYEYKPGRKRPEKMLSVKDEKTGMLYIVYLRESWYDTRCNKGSYVHIIGNFDRTGQCVVNDAENMIILHPDHLISSTVVGDSFTCTRRAVLQDRVKATGAATQPQVYGHILHEVFGQALCINTWDVDTIRAIIAKILPNYLESLYEINVQMQDAAEYLLGKAPELMAWASVFVGDTLSPDAVARDRHGLLVPTTINKLLELEEHIWSPMYGLKGNIDATVQAQMKLPEDSAPRTLLVPFELKTGKRDNVEQHRVQTALYTLLLSDRYDINVTCGILYYLESSKTFRVEGVRNELRHMIIERNELSCYVHDKLALPPMIKKEHLCKNCYSKPACFIYHKLSEGGDGVSSGLGDIFNEVVDHLSPAHQTFFRKWDDLLTREERDSMKFRRELWTMLSSEREAVGRCFSEVMIQPGSAFENPGSSKINRFEYTFVKHKPRPGYSFTESQITTGDPIVISDENGHFNFAAGFVTNVRPTRVVVAVDRKLRQATRTLQGFDSVKNQVFSGVIAPEIEDASASDSPFLYRIDKDEFANGMATARNNIIRMMEKDLWRARELRQLIIDNKPPEFKVSSTAYTLTGTASQSNLNIDQRRAIEKVMSAKDYALILGMPGTGKTTTIAHIIRALVSQGKSVLLASYTHTAVDNILLKIKDDKIPILRIGAVNKVHPDIKSFAHLSGAPKHTMEDLRDSWENTKVVATTCLGVSHGIFNARTFDYCIVDEASQITLPVCLGPIRMARTFILVGDHYQLPPLVQNKQALEGGLDVSLFKLLSDAQPESVVNLEHQYRMAEDIMLLSKELVYIGRIKCGNEAVANRTLHIPDLEAGLTLHHHTASTAPLSSQDLCLSDSSCWLMRALLPSSRCLFLNTDTINSPDSGQEAVSGARITNTCESKLTAQLVATLIDSGIAPRSIGVITFYRSQLALIRSDVKTAAGSVAAGEVEMHTADKYQGRDKEVVILSCVRSNKNSHVGDLLKDWRRVNVAVTRARSKLLILGSKQTLGGSDVPILQGMVRIMLDKGWVLDLPMGATQSHLFEAIPGPTQKSTFTRGGDRGSSHPASTVPTKEQRPLGTVAAANGSPKKRNGTFRTPDKVVRGSCAVLGQAEKLLASNPVVQDVMNELDSGDGLTGKENYDLNVNMMTDDMDLVDMDADFDPTDFGLC
ncbi:uncharacterized protein PV06_10061 [Exophiala oligosperma]|uniref:DNA replication ATP-dependent helicase/nuclease n=1 Tax=Exophiala oligosperma TaxID=215243 RepID=A0A0D2DQM7_9EURO|nr:uncharacterized protein PV06_10061 [Exophiala oligosperma]KIW38094.1 hypothetical protein PV06_10061 [Exophiala oligosperma]